MKKRTYLILGLIVLLASVLRLVNLTTTLPLYWDEVSIGYNAYSIAETGKDEYGTLLPLTFKGYNDYKFPGAIYVTVPFAKMLGPTDLATRIPSAIMGIIAIPALYFLVVNLMRRAGVEALRKRYMLGIFAAFMLAISPWHIHFSRAAFEANIALTFVIIGMTFLIKEKKQWTLPLSLLFLLLAMYTYRSELIFVPGMLIVGLCMLRRDLLRKKLETGIFLVIFILLALPIYRDTFFGHATSRGEQVSISSNAQENINSVSQAVAQSSNQMLGRALLNYRFVYVTTFVENYLPNLTPSFLFVTGDPNPRHSTPWMGVLYLWEIIFVALGLYYATKFERRLIIFIIAWILLATIPSGLTTPSPHALRTLNNVPMFALLTSLGLYFGYIKTKKHKYIYISTVSAVIIIFLARYLYLYHSVAPNMNSDAWGGGYTKVTEYINNHQDNNFVITGKYWNPYMYTLFYQAYDPRKYQESGDMSGFGKYKFGGTSWDTARNSQTLDSVEGLGDKQTIFLLSPEEFEKNKNILIQTDTLQDKTGKMVFVVARRP